MHNLNDFIKKEREKREIENPQPVQSPTNVRSSLLALKNAVDGIAPLQGNPIIENIKKVENVVERKTNNSFVQPILEKQNIETNIPYEEKDDQFTKDLLMKTRQFITGAPSVQQQIVKENTIYQSPVVEPDVRYNHNHLNVSGHSPSKNDILSALKDTITDLYVKEKIESVIKEYLQTDEGKTLIKSIVIGLFKKK
jgi:hypothetical protein